MGRKVFQRMDMNCDHEQEHLLSRPAATLSPARSGGEGRERGRFMGRDVSKQSPVHPEVVGDGSGRRAAALSARCTRAGLSQRDNPCQQLPYVPSNRHFLIISFPPSFERYEIGVAAASYIPTTSPMRKSKILAKIRAGKVARVCSAGSPIALYPALAAHFHYDGIWVDAEHRVWDPREADAALARHHAADIDCLWRPPTKEKNALYRLLEDGATGLMIPHVATAEQARVLVQAMKFPPLGDRGFCGGGRDANFWVGAPKDYTTQANRETFLTVQIETKEALDNVDAIAAVEGVDVLFLGPGDMSLRLGCTAGVSDPIMLDVQRTIATACRKHGKAWGRPVGTIDDARILIELGGQLVAFGSEFGGLHKHLSECSAQFDQLLNEVSGAPAATPTAGKTY